MTTVTLIEIIQAGESILNKDYMLTYRLQTRKGSTYNYYASYDEGKTWFIYDRKTVYYP